MSSIIRWRNGLMALSVMAISSCLTRGYEPRDLETGRAILLIPTSNPTRARSRRDVYRASGLVLGSIPDVRDEPELSPSQPARGQRCALRLPWSHGPRIRPATHQIALPIDRKPYRPTLADSGDSAPCGRGRRMRDVANGGKCHIANDGKGPRATSATSPGRHGCCFPRAGPTPARLGGRPRCPVGLSRLASTTWIIVASC